MDTRRHSAAETLSALQFEILRCARREAPQTMTVAQRLESLGQIVSAFREMRSAGRFLSNEANR